MADNNINIRLSVSDSDESKRKLDSTAKSAEGVGKSTQETSQKTEGASRGIVRNVAAMAAAFAAAATAAVAAASKVIKAIDDIRKATTQAVKELGSLQKASANYFEAFDAYTPQARKEALQQARSFQQQTGLSIEDSKALLESYKRQFGGIDAGAVDQLAGYWQLHGGAETSSLVRWMGANNIADQKRQGQILRMISATATQTGLTDAEVIQGITQYSTEFRQFGWTPEQTIANVGKTMSGLSGREARRAISGLVEGLKSFDEEKAVEMGAPQGVAESDTGRLAWVLSYTQGMASSQRNKFMQEAFGKTYASYVSKYLTSQMPPDAMEALQYAQSEQAAIEERQRVEGVRKTAESLLEKGAGISGKLGQDVREQQKYDAVIREIGADYLDWLLRNRPGEYHRVKLFAFGNEEEKRVAAYQLWKDTMTEQEREQVLGDSVGADYTEYWKEWGGYSYGDKMQRLGIAADRLTSPAHTSNVEIHNHNEIIYTPIVGADQYKKGERVSPLDVP